MNKSKLILPAIAFVAAITCAFTTNSNLLTVSGFYQVVDNPSTPANERACIAGVTNEDGCSVNNSGIQCTINVSGNPTAYSIKSGSSCASPYKLPVK